MDQKPKRGRPPKLVEAQPPPVPEVAAPPSAETPEPVTVAIIPTAATTAIVSVADRCPWIGLQSGGRWFVKGSPQSVSVDEPAFAEWAANPFLAVEVLHDAL